MKDLAKKNQSKSNHKAFSGIGFKLGETDEASEQVAGPSSKLPNSIESTSIKLYKNGFTVNDGELRLYDDPENKLFLTSIRKGYALFFKKKNCASLRRCISVIITRIWKIVWDTLKTGLKFSCCS